MIWEKPMHEELSLACEVSGYANAELDAPVESPFGISTST